MVTMRKQRLAYVYHEIWNKHHPDDLKLLGDGFVIHHKDENPENNDIENLQKMPRGEHQRLHVLEKWAEDDHRRKMSECHQGEKNHFYGRTHSDETKQRLSNMKRGEYVGEKNPMWAKKHSDVTREKMSKAQSGENNPNFGKKCTESLRKKLSQKRKEWWNMKKLQQLTVGIEWR